MLPLASALFLLGHVCLDAAAQTLTSSAGQMAAIPRWDLQSSALLDWDPARVSMPGHNTSSWHHVEAPRCTLMGCLLAVGVYNEADLWFSDNLAKFDAGQFSVPWVYRNEFSLAPRQHQHYLLETHGITSKADVYLNGKQIATKEVQAGSFGGHTYDVSGVVASHNALVVAAFPGDFNYDLIQGFVDWNPPPPDNATGVWRDIHVKQTGPVYMGPVSVSIDKVETALAMVTVRARAHNLERREVQLLVKSKVTDPSGHGSFFRAAAVRLAPEGSELVEISHRIKRPKIWWPRQWGYQPLYVSELVFLVDLKISDTARQRFGIRTVASRVNRNNDTMFLINGHPFQVIGGGYAPDQFLRWDKERFTTIAKYSLDMGLNTIRLEGTLEHPELYQIADELGIMIMVGWVCCSKWEAWKHNRDLDIKPFPYWDERDYSTANSSIIHEASMLRNHPSVIAFLIGSDSWPDDRAAKIYVDALGSVYWRTPIIASASKRGYPKIQGPSGLKMDGPYDWVPPNYWYDTEPSGARLGAAFGFGSELGAGVGTPEYGSLSKFLSQQDMEDLWMRPEKDLFHMSTNKSSFKSRRIYNQALFQKYGRPISLQDYLLKAQIMDYEATRAQHEAYASRWSALGPGRPATGTIYWMLNNAWPSLHWNLFDYAMHPAGSYFGAKTAGRLEHVAYDYVDKSVWVINRSLDRQGVRVIAVELIDMNGKTIWKQELRTISRANSSVRVAGVCGMKDMGPVAFLRLVLFDNRSTMLSRNVYWVSSAVDVLDWSNSTWYSTPVTKYADFDALSSLKTARISLGLLSESKDNGSQRSAKLELENQSSNPAFFIRLNLVDESDEDINPVIWSDNYLTLWPRERLVLDVGFRDTGHRERRVMISGWNTEPSELTLRSRRKLISA